MARTSSDKSLAASHAKPFPGSKVSGMQIYLIALMAIAVIAVALSYLF